MVADTELGLEDEVVAKQLKPKAGSEIDNLVLEPSQEWGWHGHFSKATRISGWVVIVFLLAMITSDRLGHIPEVYLTALAVLMVLVLVSDLVRRRNFWRR